MIAILKEDESTLKLYASDDTGTVGYHPVYGFASIHNAEAREKTRVRVGFKPSAKKWVCRFHARVMPGGLVVEAIEGCRASRDASAEWSLVIGSNRFLIRQSAGAAMPFPSSAKPDQRSRFGVAVAALVALTLAVPLLFRATGRVSDRPIPPIAIQIFPREQNTVALHHPMNRRAEKRAASATAVAGKSGGSKLAPNLGFLSLLGKKDLKRALGSTPSGKTEVTPGAGEGGKVGGGGELLVGLGQGLKRTSAGSSGVEGLGGIGNAKGKGGGAGGYGTALIGSGGEGNTLHGIGNGRTLVSQPLSDELVLEGGLDKGVIQATIAKYLSQVRACYETALQKSPGLEGQLTMEFAVGADGRLDFARVKRSSLANPLVEECIQNKMLGWQFPKPLGGVQVKVSYPFLLRSSGQT